jgi:electron-transferring-flavoprotein dehydrogenase
MSRINVLIAGAGPAGLATAIRLKQKLNEAQRSESVVVIEKASRLGYHTLSGGVFEAACLDELAPGWQQLDDPFIKSMVKIERDELYYLSKTRARAIPRAFIPAAMHHEGDYAISLAAMVEWMGRLAAKEGAEIHTGFSAEKILLENGAMRGIKLLDSGLDRTGQPKANFLPGEEVKADVTVLADGSRGVLSRQLIEHLGQGQNPQVYSIGMKQLIRLPPDNTFGDNRAIHTLGFPNSSDVFGGSFMYSMGNNTVAVGVILGLDWKYTDMNGQLELETLKMHPFVADLLKGGQVVVTGAKVIPEGGFYSLPELFTDGALLIGDAAGFVNMQKIKGIHYAIRSGICAADAIFDAIVKGDFSKATLASYRAQLESRGILEELWKARNYRQSFKFGTLVGAPLSQLQNILPFRLGMEKDHEATRLGAKLNRPKVGMDKPQFTSLSGAMHREDEPSHLKIIDAAVCAECSKTYGSPCVSFCPGEVYRMKGTEMIVSHTNCLHDGSCQVKCPMQNILWTPPEGGEGPRYKHM